MARLNEPPALVDSFDNLRRKFLRQNRDIARVNSNQSLRIRGLENECARLLSENLELRGQVLRLEKELEDNKSQRVAEHALQLKQKMEAQLIELGSLIASFGLEPPTKRQSPVTVRRTSRPPRSSHSSETLSPQQRKSPALSPGEAESLAAHEGRLPPIYENKTFPRQTLNREEILALHSDEIEATGSPELGPPPVSRLLRDDLRKPAGLVKPASDRIEGHAPTTKSEGVISSKEESSERATEETDAAKNQQPKRSGNVAKQNSETEKKVALRAHGTNTKITESAPAPESSTVAPSTSPSTVASTPTSKAGAKRKFAVNDENAVIRGMKAANGNGKAAVLTARGQTDNGTSTRELKNPRSIRNLVSSRKDLNEVSSDNKITTGGRMPLAAKSTNEDISSPRKQVQRENGKLKSGNGLNTDKAVALGGRMRNRMKTPLTVDIPDAPPLIAAIIDAEGDKTSKPATSLILDEQVPAHLELEAIPSPEPEADISCPSTPPPLATALLSSQRQVAEHNEGRDTPPPADISLQGEMPRPSRRARASVSYAEPNLRDKMRRPTKELFDAVAGEGKYVQRQHLQSQHHDQDQDQDDEAETAAAASMKSDIASSTAEHHQAKEEQEAPQQRAASDKRKQRASSVGLRESEENPINGSAAAEGTSGHSIGQDPYEFTVSSSLQSQETGDEESETGAGEVKGRGSSTRKPAPSNARASLKTARRSSTATSREDGSSAADRHTRPSAARKRASMVALKKGSMLDDDEDDPADSSYEPPAAESGEVQTSEGRAMSTRDRISRRRSMML